MDLLVLIKERRFRQVAIRQNVNSDMLKIIRDRGVWTVISNGYGRPAGHGKSDTGSVWKDMHRIFGC